MKNLESLSKKELRTIQGGTQPESQEPTLVIITSTGPTVDAPKIQF